MRFGSDSGDQAELTAPGAMALGPNGHLFVFDYRVGHIKEFDQAGKVVRVIGRQGKGPGEFANVYWIGFVGDTLWTSDVDLRRVTLFDLGGRTIRTIALAWSSETTGLLPSPPRALLAGGTAVAQGTPFARSGAIEIRAPIVRLNLDGHLVDTIAGPVMTVAAPVAVVAGARRTGLHEQPFTSKPSWAPQPDGAGIVVVEIVPAARPGSLGVLAVRAFDELGAQVNRRDLPFTPVAVPANIRDSVVNAWSATGGANVRRSVNEQLYVPAFLPPVTGVIVGRDRSIWMRREEFGPAAGRWDILTTIDGEVANVVIPKTVRVGYADLTQVLGIERDADGVPWIVRFRVVR